MHVMAPALSDMFHHLADHVQATVQGSVSSFRQAAPMPAVLSVQLSRSSDTR